MPAQRFPRLGDQHIRDTQIMYLVKVPMKLVEIQPEIRHQLCFRPQPLRKCGMFRANIINGLIDSSRFSKRPVGPLGDKTTCILVRELDLSV